MKTALMTDKVNDLPKWAGLSAVLADRHLRYLSAVAVNTVFGYVVSLSLYYVLVSWLHIIAIGLLCNLVCITFSYLTYKLFVFQTRGNWLSEYWRCWLVYGGSALFATVSNWLLVDFLHLSYWFASAASIGLTVLVSWFGHSKFTFRESAGNG